MNNIKTNRQIIISFTYGLSNMAPSGELNDQKQPPEVLFKLDARKNLANFRGKHLSYIFDHIFSR